jgi:hypothetical protein
MVTTARELPHDALQIVRTRDLEEIPPACLDGSRYSSRVGSDRTSFRNRRFRSASGHSRGPVSDYADAIRPDRDAPA